MGSLGMPEILIILVIALIVFGPRKLPELGKSLGKSLAQFRRASEDFKRQWEDEVTIERQRLEAPAPIEQSSYPAADSTGSEETQSSYPAADSTGSEETQSSYPAADSTGGEETQSSAASAAGAATAAEEPAQITTASEEPVAAHHEETAAQETKRDWM